MAVSERKPLTQIKSDSLVHDWTTRVINLQRHSEQEEISFGFISHSHRPQKQETTFPIDISPHDEEQRINSCTYTFLFFLCFTVHVVVAYSDFCSIYSLLNCTHLVVFTVSTVSSSKRLTTRNLNNSRTPQHACLCTRWLWATDSLIHKTIPS